MEEYKGIYYGDESERKFFEGGAHFQYIKLYKVLDKIAKERNAKEKEKELFIHTKNNLSNSLNKQIIKDKRTRNILSYLDSNKISYNTISMNTNNNKNDSFNYLQQTYSSLKKTGTKNKIKNNSSLPIQKKIVTSRNKESNLIFKGRPNTFLSDEMQKILFSRKNHLISSSMEQKIKNKNKFIMPPNNKRSLPELNNKINNYFEKKNLIKINRSNNNFSNTSSRYNNTVNCIQSNISYLGVNRMGLKTERFYTLGEPNEIEEISENLTEIIDNKNKSQNNLNIINYTNNYTNSLGVKKTLSKINKKKTNINDNKNSIKGRTKSNITSDVNNKIIQQFTNAKKDKDKSKERKDIIINRTNRKKNIKKNFIIHNNTFYNNTNYNNQFYKIMKDPNKIKIDKVTSNKNSENINKKLENNKKIERHIINKNNLNQLSFNKYIGKSRNINGIESSFVSKKTLCNKDSNNLLNMNSTNKIKNHLKLKNLFKTMLDIDKISNNKSNNHLIFKKINNNKKNLDINHITSKNPHIVNNTDVFGKLTPKINKKIYKNALSASNKGNEISKTKLIIKPYTQIKVSINGHKNGANKSNNIKIEENYNSNNIIDIKNNLINNKNIIINSNRVYVKPKNSQCCLKKNSCSNRSAYLNKMNNNIISLNNTQKPFIRKKKAIISSKYKI